MASSRLLLLLVPTLLAITQLEGCGASVSPELLELQSRILLSTEPSDAITIEEARTLLAEGDAEPEVVLIVKAGNKEFPNWCFDDKAVMVVSEAFPGSDYNVGPDHDPSTCPFCKWKWKNEDSLAFLQIVDAEGNIVPQQCDEILDVYKGDFMTVRGTVKLDETGFLLVRVGGIFLHD